MAAAMARAMPVLPEVGSMRVSPGLMRPFASASFIMLRAGLYIQLRLSQSCLLNHAGLMQCCCEGAYEHGQRGYTAHIYITNARPCNTPAMICDAANHEAKHGLGRVPHTTPSAKQKRQECCTHGLISSAVPVFYASSWVVAFQLCQDYIGGVGGQPL